jgi:phosphoribosylformimino-5-aminoimidazole carboxamide ribotide isomerase
MLILPAIDLKGGRCVRLQQGEMDRETLFSDHPEEMAGRWESLGARFLHIVDLDGAVAGSPQNETAIKHILQSVSIPLELGGGIRSLDTIEHYLSLGVNRVVLGTIAHKQPALLEEACKKFPGRIVVGIDARDGMVAVEGWKETTAMRAVDLVNTIENKGVEAIIFTDIKRDGMMSGPNLQSTRAMAEATGIPVIASGGVTSLDHIRELLRLESCGVEGIIIGRALYEGSINLKDALALVNEKNSET